MTAASQETAAALPRIAKENYLSREFLEAEKANLWPKVWQVACRTEEIPNPGDYVTYDIADDSVIVVRATDGSIQAFHNVCPHRGRTLTDGCGHAANFRCPFHGWTFRLDGRNVAVQDRDDWNGALEANCANLDLKPVAVGQWGGFVFVNLDPDCEPLLDYLAPIPEYLDPFEYENMRYRWYLQLRLPCNWKVALEAFLEGYHVAATHTQLLPNQGDDYTQSYAHGKHAHFGYWKAQQPLGVPSPRLKMQPPADSRPGVIRFFEMMEEQFRAIFTDRDYEAAKGILQALPPDTDAATAFGVAVEFGRKAAEADGCGYPANLTWEALAKAGTGWTVFPNSASLPWFDGAVWYRARPNGDDPDSCVFDIWSLKRYAPGKEPPLERQIVTDIEGRSFGLIVDQDLANMKRVQRGMKSRAFSHALTNPVQEVAIHNLHRELERRVLGAPRDAGD